MNREIMTFWNIKLFGDSVVNQCVIYKKISSEVTISPVDEFNEKCINNIPRFKDLSKFILSTFKRNYETVRSKEGTTYVTRKRDVKSLIGYGNSIVNYTWEKNGLIMTLIRYSVNAGELYFDINDNFEYFLQSDEKIGCFPQFDVIGCFSHLDDGWHKLIGIEIIGKGPIQKFCRSIDKITPMNNHVFKIEANDKMFYVVFDNDKEMKSFSCWMEDQIVEQFGTQGHEYMKNGMLINKKTMNIIMNSGYSKLKYIGFIDFSHIPGNKKFIDIVFKFH